MGVYLYDWSYEELKSVFDKAEETQIGAFTEVKTPHGRLIDAEMLTEYALNQTNKSVTPNAIMRFPCVIEAEVK